MRVLVVEDEPRLADNIATALRDGPGYAVDLTADGQEALFLCGTREYDLVLLDLMIPTLSGQDVVRRLRSANNGTPVLVLTALSNKQTTIELLNLGAGRPA